MTEDVSQMSAIELRREIDRLQKAIDARSSAEEPAGGPSGRYRTRRQTDALRELHRVQRMTVPQLFHRERAAEKAEDMAVLVKGQWQFDGEHMSTVPGDYARYKLSLWSLAMRFEVQQDIELPVHPTSPQTGQHLLYWPMRLARDPAVSLNDFFRCASRTPLEDSELWCVTRQYAFRAREACGFPVGGVLYEGFGIFS